MPSYPGFCRFCRWQKWLTSIGRGKWSVFWWTMALRLRERLERFCIPRRIKSKVDSCTESGCFLSHACRLHTGLHWSDVDWSLEVMLRRGHLIEGGSKRPSQLLHLYIAIPLSMVRKSSLLLGSRIFPVF